MVGDDLEGDLMGALKWGLQAVWYNLKGTDAPPGVHHITDLMQLTSTQQNPASDTTKATPYE